MSETLGSSPDPVGDLIGAVADVIYSFQPSRRRRLTSDWNVAWELAREIYDAVAEFQLDEDLIVLSQQDAANLVAYLRASTMDQPPEIRDAWWSTPVGEIARRLESSGAGRSPSDTPPSDGTP